jgi:rhodanese-related sulfurtransferase
VFKALPCRMEKLGRYPDTSLTVVKNRGKTCKSQNASMMLLKKPFLALLMMSLLTGLMATALSTESLAMEGRFGLANAGSKEKLGQVSRISAEQLKKLMDEGADVVIVDTQDERIYHLGHIKGAINLSWAPTIREPIHLPRGKLLILYCGCIDEEASEDVASQLTKEWGYKNIKVLEGGFLRWLKLGYPTEKGQRKWGKGREDRGGS